MKRVILTILLVFAGLFILGAEGCNVDSPDIECLKDSDCAVAGCSSQLCVPADKSEGLITTCEFKDEYTCLRFTSCGCNQGKCSWEENPTYQECLAGVSK